MQEIQIQRTDHNQVQNHHHHHLQTHQQQQIPGQMIVTNVLNNNTAQLLNTGQIVTANGQLIQTANGQLAQIVSGPNNTVQMQMITQNGAPAQVLQIQRTGDGDRCEIYVQPSDMGGETQYLMEDGNEPF